ncbi:ribosomal RNA-processing protein 17 [[Candida] jaroonii]|uniref:Ribosomal RNA-processing protein 17 n=1 Tax=[Candida] jaroonii TaxID=467808 RepID=A0ACA9Y820_9ASCO|nr:ribosomal RNA-processing protein 17 [[Candida] jaroonii]
MVRTNREILTGGKKYIQRQQKKFGVDEVVFDKDSRQEYLTGFHKRKVQRQKKAQEYIKEQDRIARVEERKRLREERKKDLETQLKQFNSNVLQVSSDDDEDWDGFGGDKDDSEAEKSEEEEQEQNSIVNEVYHVEPEIVEESQAIIDDDTTVTIEAVDNPLMTNIQDLQEKAKANNVDLSRAQEVLQQSIKRAQNYAITVNGKDNNKDKDRRKKKFRYLTKTERRDKVRKERSKNKPKKDKKTDKKTDKKSKSRK